MKKLFIFILLASFSMAGSAQDDDVYFVPSKKKSKTTKVTTDDPYAEGVGRRIGDFPDPFEGESLGEEGNFKLRDVDEYNRRPNALAAQQTDTVYADEEELAVDDAPDGDCTARIVRFHSPRAGVYVSSPYYIDFYDVYYNPWYTPTWAVGLGFGLT